MFKSRKFDLYSGVGVIGMVIVGYCWWGLIDF